MISYLATYKDKNRRLIRYKSLRVADYDQALHCFPKVIMHENIRFEIYDINRLSIFDRRQADHTLILFKKLFLTLLLLLLANFFILLGLKHTEISYQKYTLLSYRSAQLDVNQSVEITTKMSDIMFDEGIISYFDYYFLDLKITKTIESYGDGWKPPAEVFYRNPNAPHGLDMWIGKELIAEHPLGS